MFHHPLLQRSFLRKTNYKKKLFIFIADLSDGRKEDKTHVEPTLGGVIGERQRSIIESFQRLLRQRKLSKDEKQRNNLSPDDMTFQKYFSASPPLRHTIDKLVKDYDRDLNWYRNSKVLKRETLESSPFQEDLSPAGHHSRRSDSAFRSGSRVARRRHVRHYRKKFMEKAERSGWGGGYG